MLVILQKHGTGTEADPYQIRCIEDLVGLSRTINTDTAGLNGKYIVLTKDLDFNSIYSYSNYKSKYVFNSSKNAYYADNTGEQTIKELCTSGLGFIPITNLGSASSSAFRGTFDGQGHSITNLYINSTNNTGNKGLFGKIYQGTVKNLTIDGLIKGKVTGGGGIGGIAGSASSGSYITNCVNKATVEGTECVAAGIVASGSANVQKCVNEGTIKVSSSSAYGIGRAGTTNKCINKGLIIGTGASEVYGIGNGTVTNCYNSANIGNSTVGAAVGMSSSRSKKLL